MVVSGAIGDNWLVVLGAIGDNCSTLRLGLQLPGGDELLGTGGQLTQLAGDDRLFALVAFLGFRRQVRNLAAASPTASEFSLSFGSHGISNLIFGQSKTGA